MEETYSLDLDLPSDYQPSRGELNNLCYLTCKYTTGWTMRQSDFAVCVMLAGGKEAIAGNAGISNFVFQTCEYVWDHIAGEPEEVNATQLFLHMKSIVQEWYGNTDAAMRASID